MYWTNMNTMTYNKMAVPAKLFLIIVFNVFIMYCNSIY
jgi:hypothetical protein